MKYETYFENDWGLVGYFITAKNRREFIAQMKELFPDDCSADGFAIDPVSGDEFALDW